jgi:TonB-linked SusC/RagA family outer membrane protein
MLASGAAWAQERTISGKITSAEDGSALPGVNIVIKGTTKGTVSDSDGNYTLAVPSGNETLTFTFIGLLTQEVAIGGRNRVDVSMAQDVQQLTEVVVTAGGLIVQKKELGNMATTVKASDISQGKSVNPVAGLQGKVPGLLISAVSSGVNPNYRVVLRGQRSILGNNQALLVLDNIITPNSVLGNLNPEDIEDIQVLNGPGAAALYGSDASNGALIVTTKRSRIGTEIKVSNTTTMERTSYLPSLQREFGSGTTPDTPPVYTPYENQQYGPRFDGSMRPIGKPIESGDIQTVPYSPTDARTDFWETGLMNQTDFSVNSGDEQGGIYAAGQYFKQNSTVPWDKYKRYSFRVNIDREVGEKVKVFVGANYIHNQYDISSAPGTAYNDVLMSPAQVDITKYRDWRNDPFANPNGYFNEYYDNPYFTLQNNRANTKNSYFQGSFDLRYSPIDKLTFIGRIGLSTRNVFTKNTTGKFTFSDYTKDPLGANSGSSKTDIAGSVSDGGLFDNQLIGDFLVQYNGNLSDDITIDAVAGVQGRENSFKGLNVNANGLVISDVYNVGNTLTNLTGSEANVRSTQFGVYGDVRFGYKDWAFLHFTGRNDWRSVLAKENRSFFYPNIDASIIVSDGIPSLKASGIIDELKIRGGWSRVGNVNIGPYALATTFNQAYGFPYAIGGGFSLANVLVSPNLEPEMTTSIETGFDLYLTKYDAMMGLTLYKSNTEDQTIPVQLPSSSGYSSLLTNVGEVENRGLESYFQFTPISTSSGLAVTLRANYTIAKNKVLSLSDDSDLMILPGAEAEARVVAKVGQPFPFLQVTKYNRTPDGKIIVDDMTGFPATDGSFHDVGTTAPPHFFGLSAEVKYKRFRLNATADYRNGHYIYNSISTAFDFSGAGIRTTWFNRERFIMPNSAYEDPENPGTYIDNTSVTTTTGGADFWTDGTRNTDVGENYTHSAGFWKLREVSLRYDVPSSFLSKVGFIKGAYVSIQGRNLFIWTPKTNLYTDPEFSSNGADSNAIGFTNISLTPPARYIGGTVSLTF